VTHRDAEVDVGEADARTRRALLASARCLLAPVTWNEPFGLFLVEAMACGTPVVALGRGSIPEVVEDGVTGFVVQTVEELCEALDRLDAISPEACRKRALEHFDVPRMADDYLDACALILETTSEPPGPSPRPRAGEGSRLAA
jgi:glycosyltransferase involved in cell wall biosynthesis